MKRIFVLCICFFCLPAVAESVDDVRTFFNSYVKDANSYNKHLGDYYSDNAKIIRIIIKPDGTKQSVDFRYSDYMNQLRKRSKIAKLVRYKNRYENVQISDLGDGKYKITALRYPMRDKKGLNFHFIVQETENGLKVVEESMETTVQTFLKYAK